MVITDPDSDDAVACGDILRPDADRVRGSRRGRGAAAPGRVERRQGVAAIERARSSGSWTSRRPGLGSSSPPSRSACRPKRQPATRGTSRAGGASRRPDDVRVELGERGRRYDVTPFQAVSAETGRARHGRLLRVGRRTRLRAGRRLHRAGLLAGHRGPRIGRAGRVRRHPRTGRRRVHRGRTGARAAPARPVTPGCRDTPSWIGWTMQRELDVTPTLVRIVLFAPPATDE